MRPTLVILAAGAGNRYGGLKQLAPIGTHGETLLEYTAFDALRAGFSRVVVVVRPETESGFRDKLSPGMARHISLAFVHQTLDDLPSGCSRSEHRIRPWGTGQAVLAAEDEIDGPFAVVNADDFYGAESFAVLSRFLETLGESERIEIALIGFKVAQTLTDAGPVSRALCQLNGDGRLQEIVEIKEVWRQGQRIVYLDRGGGEQALHGDEVVSMNMWGFSHEIFPELQRRFRSFLMRTGADSESEFLLPDMVRDLLHEDRIEVEVLRGADQWCGITFREDQKRVASIISDLVSQGRYPKELWA